MFYRRGSVIFALLGIANSTVENNCFLFLQLNLFSFVERDFNRFSFVQCLQHGGDRKSDSAIKHYNVMLDKSAQGTSKSYTCPVTLSFSAAFLLLFLLNWLILAGLFGRGESPEKIEAILKDSPEVLVMWREAMNQHGGDRGNQHTGGKRHIVTLAKSARGHSKSYTLSRLEKNEPELPAGHHD